MKLIDLINSTNKARKKQYETRRVGAVDVKHVPRSKQLYVTAQAFPLSDKTKKAPYKVTLVFNGIESSGTPDEKHPLPYSEDGPTVKYYINQPTVQSNIQLRCQCLDYYFMWQYYNKQNKSLIGPHKPYVRKTDHYPPRNPRNLPGLCKHQVDLVKLLMDQQILKKNVKVYDYLSRKRKPVDY